MHSTDWFLRKLSGKEVVGSRFEFLVWKIYMYPYMYQMLRNYFQSPVWSQKLLLVEPQEILNKTTDMLQIWREDFWMTALLMLQITKVVDLLSVRYQRKLVEIRLFFWRFFRMCSKNASLGHIQNLIFSSNFIPLTSMSYHWLPNCQLYLVNSLIFLKVSNLRFKNTKICPIWSS